MVSLGVFSAGSTEVLAFQALAITDAAGALIERLVQSVAVPEKSREEARHVALAAAHGTEFMVTWNRTHIENARMRRAIQAVCREGGYEPQFICTPRS